MNYIDFSHLFKKTILQCIKAKIKRYPNNIVNSNEDEEKIKSLKIQYTGKYPESLSDYCDRVLTGEGIVSSFDSPNILKILYDPNILSKEKVEKRIRENGLIIEIIDQKSVEARFGIFKF